ncbi:complement factor H-related protein 2-like [Vipera latastei]
MEKLDSWIHPHLLIPVFEFRVPGDKCGSQPALWQGALCALLMNNFGRRAEEMDIYNPTGESLLDLIQLSQPISEGSKHVEARNVTETTCPSRKKSFVMRTGHVCQRSCERRQCSKSRKCACDGKCGLSCISPAVTCSRPTNVAQATLVAVHQSEYPVGTVIYYLCHKDFYLDGSNRVICLKNGSWSQLPYCRARCPIIAQRSRMIYHGRKVWAYEIPNGLVHHGETVTFFCRSQNKTCSFEAESSCFDGVLKMPDCYDEPTYLQYHLFPQRVVSEIRAC